MACRVLICDDNDADVSLLLRSFATSSLSVDIVRAKDGEEALNLLKGSPELDLIVLDQRLPRKSGRDVIEALHSLRRFPDCPVVVLTSRVGEADRKAMIALGVHELMEKPLTLEGYLKMGESLAALCP
jgi:CheY-like chemotaxis protein